jgi:hypothetical protein
VPRLQKGLVVAEKEERVAAYARGVVQEVEMIAHSVGVAEPRQLRRRHVRLVQADGTSIPMNEVYPSYRAGEPLPHIPRPPDAGHSHPAA